MRQPPQQLRGLRRIDVAPGAADPADCDYLRPGSKLRRALRNAQRLGEAKKRQGAKHPQIRIVLMLLRRNLDQLRELVRLAGEHGADSIVFQHLWHDVGATRRFVEAESLLKSDASQLESYFREAQMLADELGVALSLPAKLNVADTNGDSIVDGHEKWITISSLQLGVDQSDPVKISILTLRNDSKTRKKLTLTWYLEWVLGVTRDQTQHFVRTSFDERTQSMRAAPPATSETVRFTRRAGAIRAAKRMLNKLSVDPAPALLARRSELQPLIADRVRTNREALRRRLGLHHHRRGRLAGHHLALRGIVAVHPAGDGRASRLLGHERQRKRDRRDLPPSGRPATRHRTGSIASPDPLAAGDPVATWRPADAAET